MMKIVSKYEDIDLAQWQSLVSTSPTGTWFQTPEAYEFYASVPEEMMPFVVAVTDADVDVNVNYRLRAVCVGYVTVEKNPIKQLLTRRAIIIGGPALVEDITEEELTALLNGVKSVGARRSSLNCNERRSCPLNWGNCPIYVETRNFNSYERWKSIFERCGFEYEPHLNFHVHTDQPWEIIEENIGKHRKKYIRLSYRDGAMVVEKPTVEQVKAYYKLLKHLYKKKVKTPLQPWSFFEKLYALPSCHYILIEYNGQIVGGSICMALDGRGVYEWFACGNDHVYKNIYPSSVTKYAGMKFAFDNGYPLFDMMGAGKPGVEYGVRDFKAEFGGELVEHGRFKYIGNPMLYMIGKLGVLVLKMIK